MDLGECQFSKYVYHILWWLWDPHSTLVLWIHFKFPPSSLGSSLNARTSPSLNDHHSISEMFSCLDEENVSECSDPRLGKYLRSLVSLRLKNRQPAVQFRNTSFLRKHLCSGRACHDIMLDSLQKSTDGLTQALREELIELFCGL